MLSWFSPKVVLGGALAMVAGAAGGAAGHAVGDAAALTGFLKEAVQAFGALLGAMVAVVTWVDRKIDRRFNDQEKLLDAKFTANREAILREVERVVRGEP